MNQNHAIETLKKEAKTNAVASAVFHVWAIRKRARFMVSIPALAARMKKEGFNFSTGQLSSVLSLVASCGFGRLEKDAKGRVRALKEIRVTLQSIGMSVCSDKTKLLGFNQRNRYGKLPIGPTNIERTVRMTEVSTRGAARIERRKVVLITQPVSLTIAFNGKPVNLQLPKDLTKEELYSIVSRFQEDKDQQKEERETRQ